MYLTSDQWFAFCLTTESMLYFSRNGTVDLDCNINNQVSKTKLVSIHFLTLKLPEFCEQKTVHITIEVGECKKKPNKCALYKE